MKILRTFFVLLLTFLVFIGYLVLSNFIYGFLMTPVDLQQPDIQKNNSGEQSTNPLVLNIKNQGTISVSLVRHRSYGTIKEEFNGVGKLSYIYLFNKFYLPYEYKNHNLMKFHIAFFVLLLAVMFIALYLVNRSKKEVNSINSERRINNYEQTLEGFS